MGLWQALTGLLGRREEEEYDDEDGLYDDDPVYEPVGPEPIEIRCPDCRGDGGIECRHCQGTGDDPYDPEEPCGSCDGEGEFDCRSCDGEGVTVA